MTTIFAFVVTFILDGEPSRWEVYVNDCVGANRYFQTHFPDVRVTGLSCIKLDSAPKNVMQL